MLTCLLLLHYLACSCPAAGELPNIRCNWVNPSSVCSLVEKCLLWVLPLTAEVVLAYCKNTDEKYLGKKCKSLWPSSNHSLEIATVNSLFCVLLYIFLCVYGSMHRCKYTQICTLCVYFSATWSFHLKIDEEIFPCKYISTYPLFSKVVKQSIYFMDLLIFI